MYRGVTYSSYPIRTLGGLMKPVSSSSALSDSARVFSPTYGLRRQGPRPDCAMITIIGKSVCQCRPTPPEMTPITKPQALRMLQNSPFNDTA